ncbi:MAG: [protein-PII] uridylyltransferase [Magnetococcales bacterium]|nr:[protein-PII] uridylyltransferase [Magnetococcales bacterium]
MTSHLLSFQEPFHDIDDPRKKSIIDTTAFDQQLADIVHRCQGDPLDGAGRVETLALFRSLLAHGRQQLHQAHLGGASGRSIVRGHAFLTDVLLRRLLMLVKTQHVSAEGGRQAAVAAASADQQRPLLGRLRELLRSHKQRLSKPEEDEFCLIATGGYGRVELAPFSDIDLLFLLPDGVHPKFGMQVEQMLYFLWDMGLEIGHAVRNIDECLEHARRDNEICTSMLESRFLAGNHLLFKRYHTVLFEQILGQNLNRFLEEKLAEQQQRYERFGHSLFYLEPNIKENPGGLRDIHVFLWISKYRYQVRRLSDLVPLGILTEEEHRTLERCREFLRRIRNAMHYRAGRRDDRLTFQYQLEIATEFGYRDRPGMRGVEQFMRRYYQVAKQVGNLSNLLLQKYRDELTSSTIVSCQMIEEGFCLMGGKVAILDAEQFRANPTRLMKVFQVAQRNSCEIHPDTLRLVTANLDLIDHAFRRDREVAALFLAMLNGERAVAWVLRTMNACQLLGRYLPEFGRIVGQTQHDMFHVYTVDEHTILAVEALRHIRSGKFSDELPLSTQLIKEIAKPVVLYLGVMFHDIAKGRGGQHEVKGGIMARQICQRFDMLPEDVDQVVWLVENHLIFSRTAFRRDINDPQTIQQFARQIENKVNLDLLLLLTVADIRAVGPKVWNQWKAASLRQLYLLTLETLNKGLYTARDNVVAHAEGKKAEVLRILSHHYPVEQAQQHLDRFYPEYFIGYDPDSLAAHYTALAGRWQEPLAIAFTQHAPSDTTSLLLHVQDHAGLLAKVSGALASEGANILSAHGNTTRDGMALDIFVIQNIAGETESARERRQKKIQHTLTAVLTGQVYLDKLMAAAMAQRRKQDLFDVAPVIVVDNDYSDTHTILEITALDRIGLLYTMTRVMQQCGLQIITAKIATYGERAVDVFYVKDLFGLKLGDYKIKVVTRALEESLRAL